MRTIYKDQEPRSLTHHRATPGATYENYTGKDDLRLSLVAEQRGICCYCMSRIRPDPCSMKIEHWRPQSEYPNEQLTYSNLLASCLGGEGQPVDRQHCDTRKGESDLSVNPANRDARVEERIQYLSNGEIVGTSDELNWQLNNVLNLNLPTLIENRKAALTGFLDSLRKCRDPGREHWERKKREWNGDSQTGALRPFCQVIVYWLEKRIRRYRRI
ncbi:MAG: TIGR02646 family protein [Candidatus Omnitrophica bacterium]|nr:TIGR02646 family protein [Candidatus Omnitrophota bacterium]